MACAESSQYDAIGSEYIPGILGPLMNSCATMAGFLVSDFAARYDAARIEFAGLVENGNIDEETLLDTLEGITSLHELIAEVVRSRQDDLAFIAAVRARISDLQERLTRLDQRAEKKKEIVSSVLDRAGIKKITEADFTLSLRSTSPPLVVIEEKQIPDAYWKPQPPKLDRQGLLSALRAGQLVAGVVLGNGGVTISVRTK